jgi:hypothetical protein
MHAPGMSGCAVSLADVASAPHPLAREGLLARAVPFAVAVVLAPAVAVLPPGPVQASDFVPLVLLPVVWTALYGKRWQLGCVVAAVGVALGLAVALLGYPASEWRVVAIWVTVAGLLGFAVHRLVDEIGRQATTSLHDLDERLRAERRG